jgi:hypothetical protein
MVLDTASFTRRGAWGQESAALLRRIFTLGALQRPVAANDNGLTKTSTSD